MGELKPCPFCGCGDAGIVRTKTIFDHVLGFMVLCPDCGGTVGFNTDTEFTAFTDFGTEQEAVDAWNTRAERTCRMEYNEDWSGDELYPTEACQCAVCGRITQEGLPNYCPNCGAKVVEG